MRKLVIPLILVLALALALPALAAGDPAQDEINSLYQQIQELQKKLVDKYVELGQIAPEQGEYMKKNLDQAQEYRETNPEAGLYGCPGAGSGMMGGAGGFGGMMGGNGGFGGMMGGWGTGNTGTNTDAGYRPGWGSRGMMW